MSKCTAYGLAVIQRVLGIPFLVGHSVGVGGSRCFAGHGSLRPWRSAEKPLKLEVSHGLPRGDTWDPEQSLVLVSSSVTATVASRPRFAEVPRQLNAFGQSRACALHNVTSWSTSSTNLLDCLTNVQIMAAKSSIPCDSLSSAVGASVVVSVVAVDVVRDLAVRRADASPLVLRIAPLCLSRTKLALTPGFLVRRPSFSSRASCPLTYTLHSSSALSVPSQCI